MERHEGVLEMPERISVTLDGPLYEQVQRAAWADDRSMAAWIRVAIREKLERGENK